MCVSVYYLVCVLRDENTRRGPQERENNGPSLNVRRAFVAFVCRVEMAHVLASGSAAGRRGYPRENSSVCVVVCASE